MEDRTIQRLNAALAIAAMPEFLEAVPAEWLPYIMLGAALGNMYLRSVTSTAIGRTT